MCEKTISKPSIFSVITSENQDTIQSINNFKFISNSSHPQFLIRVPKDRTITLNATLESDYSEVIVVSSDQIQMPFYEVFPNASDANVFYKIPCIIFTGGGKVIWKVRGKENTKPQFNIILDDINILICENTLAPFLFKDSGCVNIQFKTDFQSFRDYSEQNDFKNTISFTTSASEFDFKKWKVLHGSFYYVPARQDSAALHLNYIKDSVRRLIDDNMLHIEDLKRGISEEKVVAMVGSGYSMLLSNDAKDWAGFLKEYAKLTIKLLNLSNTTFLEDIELNKNNQDKLLDIANDIANTINTNFVGNSLEKHRIFCQLLIRGWKTHDTEPVRVLAKLNCPILATNYDTILEDSSDHLVTMTHMEAMELGGEWEADNWLLDGTVVGNGDFLSNLKKNCVIHLHGTYTDISSDRGFTLTAKEYETEEITRNFLKFMIPVASNRSLVFIGAAGTILDPHFQHLWICLAESKVKHYVLYRKAKEYETVKQLINLNCLYGLNLIGICYGESHPELLTFLEKLV